MALDLADEYSVRHAFSRIIDAAQRARPEARIEGATMQKMVLDGQEVIVGAARDEQFGALMMFGAGGIHVEGLRDVAFGFPCEGCCSLRKGARQVARWKANPAKESKAFGLPCEGCCSLRKGARQVAQWEANPAKESKAFAGSFYNPQYPIPRS